MLTTIESEEKYGISFCDRLPLVIERGSGSTIWDESQTEYLDFTSGWGVTCLGHSHPTIVEAITKQANKIMQSPNAGFTYSPERASLLQALSEVVPINLSNFYFVNSGAEANDVALKLARKITKRSKVISAFNSFHGRTFNTLSVSTGAHISANYLPEQGATEFVGFGDITDLENKIDFDTAAVILEPIQGEGGVRFTPLDYMAKVKRLCLEHGALLIVDEIQTGFCRTGKFFACSGGNPDVQPDMMTMGKGLAGGFPIAAFAVSGEVNRCIEKGDHGGTYCGNPLGCAVAVAVVDYLRKHRVDEKVKNDGCAVGSALRDLAQRYPLLIKEVRGTGLLWAIELRPEYSVNEITQLALERGLLVVPTRSNIVRLIPSLLITAQELEQGLATLAEVFESVVQLR